MALFVIPWLAAPAPGGRFGVAASTSRAGAAAFLALEAALIVSMAWLDQDIARSGNSTAAVAFLFWPVFEWGAVALFFLVAWLSAGVGATIGRTRRRPDAAATPATLDLLTCRRTQPGEAAMARAFYLLFGFLAYLVFFATFLYLIAFVGDLPGVRARSTAASGGRLPHRDRRRSRPDRPVRPPAQRDGAAALQGGLDADRARADRAQHLRAARQPRPDRDVRLLASDPDADLERRQSDRRLRALGACSASAG